MNEWMGGCERERKFVLPPEVVMSSLLPASVPKVIYFIIINDEIEATSKDGTYISGFYMEGARWDIAGKLMILLFIFCQKVFQQFIVREI